VREEPSLARAPRKPAAAAARAESDDAAGRRWTWKSSWLAIEGQTHGDLLAFVERLAGRFVGGKRPLRA